MFVLSAQADRHGMLTIRVTLVRIARCMALWTQLASILDAGAHPGNSKQHAEYLTYLMQDLLHSQNTPKTRCMHT